MNVDLAQITLRISNVNRAVQYMVSEPDVKRLQEFAGRILRDNAAIMIHVRNLGYGGTPEELPPFDAFQAGT